MKKYLFGLICIILMIGLASCSKKEASTQSSIGETNNLEASVSPTEKAEATATTSISTKPSLASTAIPIPTVTKIPAITMTPTIPVTPTVTKRPTVTPVPTKDSTVSESEENSKYTIVIDAGHQTHSNSEKEPIGPGAKETKAKVSSGTQGRFTDIPEYKVNLAVSLKLREILTEQGYNVIMVREKNDVNISNSERAKIANDNHADAFVRIHCNGSENASVNGILTICPTKDNPYCSEIYKKSRKLSDSILTSVCEATDAKNRGVTETNTMSGINWSKVPVTIIEMGYMTNKNEDYKLTNEDYQDTLAEGIAEGITIFLK